MYQAGSQTFSGKFDIFVIERNKIFLEIQKMLKHAALQYTYIALLNEHQELESQMIVTLLVSPLLLIPIVLSRLLMSFLSLAAVKMSDLLGF
jgi:hypothetical protein